MKNGKIFASFYPKKSESQPKRSGTKKQCSLKSSTFETCVIKAARLVYPTRDTLKPKTFGGF